ncbi:ATP-binding protein [Actinophytocola glycyrrhizae]|uniref:ATP-binding protein n=1 Tax=Actinophytocola glycyrrhizae TaxID=2044873 RepID=A0ABV9SEL5_9PSEU
MKRVRQTSQAFERITTPIAAPRVITDGALVTDDTVWSWMQIPGSSTYLLEDDDLGRATAEAAGALQALLPTGADYHLKVLWSTHTAEEYRAGWDRLHSVMAPGASDYIDMGAQRITRNSEEGYFRRRVVLLGVKWTGEDEESTLRRAGKIARRGLRTQATTYQEAHEHLEMVRPQINRWFDQASRGVLRGRRAPASVIAWAYAREIRRTAFETPDDDVLSGPALVDLMHGEVDPADSPTHVAVTDSKTADRRYVSILVPATNGFPPHELELPGGEWLEILTDLPGVEASVRGVNHGQAGSIALIDHGRKTTRSQTREASVQGAQVPLDVIDADDTLNIRRQEIQRRQDVMTTNHARWVVHAATAEELADLVARVQERYTGVVRLEVVPHVQDLLWRELLPGDRVRVPEFAQHQPMRTLAGSWFHGGSTVGDSSGPYIGANLGSTPQPVQAHIVSRAEPDRSRPTTITFTGRSGAGKSTAAMLAVLGALLEGAWALLADPKGDLRGIVTVAHDLLGVPVQLVDVLDDTATGTMDPMRFCPTADLARSLTLDALLGALNADDRRRGETILEHAIDTVLRWPRDAWSAQRVINELVSIPADRPDADLARELGETLTVRARQAHMRAVLGPATPTTQPLMTGRGLVYLGLAGLELPRHNPDPDKWTVAERCSMTTFRVALHYALQQSRNVRHLKKLVALTELHLITGYPEGKAFVEWLARTGRALQTWLLLDTQAAADLAVLTGLIEQIVMSFAFQANGKAEQDAQAVLLHRPEPGSRLRTMQASLSTGDCIMLDRSGRIAPIHWDLMTAWIRDALSTDATEDTDTAKDTEDAEHGQDAVRSDPSDSAAEDGGPDGVAPGTGELFEQAAAVDVGGGDRS